MYRSQVLREILSKKTKKYRQWKKYKKNTRNTEVFLQQENTNPEQGGLWVHVQQGVVGIPVSIVVNAYRASDAWTKTKDDQISDTIAQISIILSRISVEKSSKTT